MGQSASDIISVVVSQQVASLLLPGFGIPLILSYHTHYTDRVRYYSCNAAGLAQMVTDGFTTAEAAYLAASAMTAQSPAPTQFGIGRLANPPQQRFDITPQAGTAAGQNYTVKFNGTAYTYTTVGADTVATIINGLVTAIGAQAGWSITNNASTTLRIARTSADGGFGSIQLLDQAGQPTSSARARMSLAQTHADPGIAADMAAIVAFDSKWYAVANPWDSAAMAGALAAWVQSNLKLYIINSCDDAIVGSGTGDIASTIKTAADSRVAVMYKSENGSFAQCAWLARVLPLVAGSENWAYKTLAGVPVDQLSEGEITNAAGVPTAGSQGKFASVYVSVFGVNVTEFGQVGSGSWLDITRGVDALIVDMSSRIFLDLSGPNKIPYSDKGIAVIEKDIRASLAFYTAAPQNFLAESPPFTVTVPLASTLTAGQRAARLLPNVAFQANLAGALNGVTVQGVVIP